MTPNLDETLAPPMIAVTGDLGPSIAFLIEFTSLDKSGPMHLSFAY